jgi:hypothetical protein
MIRLATAFSTAAVVALSFAGIGNVASAHSNVALAAACDATYGADVNAAGTDMSAAAKGAAADKLSASLLTLIKLRYKYEDTAAPAGCEANRQFFINSLALYEDGAYLLVAAIADTKNTTNYTDFISKTWQPRLTNVISAFTASLTAPAAAATMAATSAAAACPDSAYIKQVFGDVGTVSITDPTDAAVVGAAGLAYINLRYKYEDAKAPAGCEAGTKQFVALLGLSVDYASLSLAQLADKANASTYSDFFKTVLSPRGDSLTPALSAAFPQSASPAATAAATASK